MKAWYKHTHTYACVCIINAHILMCIHTYLCVRMHVYVYTHTYISITVLSNNRPGSGNRKAPPSAPAAQRRTTRAQFRSCSTMATGRLGKTVEDSSRHLHHGCWCSEYCVTYAYWWYDGGGGGGGCCRGCGGGCGQRVSFSAGYQVPQCFVPLLGRVWHS